MFPYPSGDIHMGHVRNYTIGDVIARHAVMSGFNVLHPIGWDAFGLPAENAAIKSGTHPATWTYANIETQAASFRRMGFSYDWDRVRAHVRRRVLPLGPVDLPEDLGAGSRRAEVVAGELVSGLHDRARQRAGHRRGRVLALQVRRGEARARAVVPQDHRLRARSCSTISTSCRDGPSASRRCRRTGSAAARAPRSSFTLCDEAGEPTDERITVFTTRPDTLFGCSFFLLAPEHPLVGRLVAGTEHETRGRGDRGGRGQGDVGRAGGAATREKHGAFTGRYVVNPVNGEKVPVWVADYVLMEYGTGAVMAVPSGDQRDFEFARKYGLPIPPVVHRTRTTVLLGTLGGVRERVHGRRRRGTVPSTATASWCSRASSPGCAAAKAPRRMHAVTAWLDERGLGRATVNFRLRDWLISRQRYWGNPIPAIHCPACGLVPVPSEQLPVVLPMDVDITKGETLADHPEFYETTCPRCGGPARRETDTMDTFNDSSLVLPALLRRAQRPAPRSTRQGRLLDARRTSTSAASSTRSCTCSTRASSRRCCATSGYCDFDEPFTNLLTQGMVKLDGATMSKSQAATWSRRRT